MSALSPQLGQNVLAFGENTVSTKSHPDRNLTGSLTKEDTSHGIENTNQYQWYGAIRPGLFRDIELSSSCHLAG